MAVKFPPFLAFQKPSTYSDKKDILLKKGIKKRAFCGPFRIIWLNLLRYFEFAPVGHEEQDAGDDAEDPPKMIERMAGAMTPDLETALLFLAAAKIWTTKSIRQMAKATQKMI